MAELGDFLSPSSEIVDVNVEMLDYTYVTECNDTKKLKGILELLRSGKEGDYPDLVRFTEERLLSLLSPKERDQIMRLRNKTTISEIQEAEKELYSWSSKKQWEESEFKKDMKSRTEKPLPPVRGSKNVAYTATATPSSASSSSSSVQKGKKSSSEILQPLSSSSSTNKKSNSGGTEPARLSGYDFRAWEKFDADKAAEDVDEQDKKLTQTKLDNLSASEKAAAEKVLRANRRHDDELEQIRLQLHANELSDIQCKTRSGNIILLFDICIGFSLPHTHAST